MSSAGKLSRNVRSTVSPPMPLSNTPIRFKEPSSRYELILSATILLTHTPLRSRTSPMHSFRSSETWTAV